MNVIHRPGKARPILIAVLVLAGLLFLWIAAEVYFAVTAKPAVDTDYATQIEELAASVQGDGENQWSAYQSIVADHTAMLQAIEMELAASDEYDGSTFDPSVVYDFAWWRKDIDDIDPGPFEPDADEELRRLGAARAAYTASLTGEGWSELSTLIRAMRVADAVVVRPYPRDTMLVETLMPELGDTRRLAQSLRARLFLAAAREDWPEYVETFADGLWLADRVWADPVLISGLVGLASRAILIEGVRDDVIAGRLPAEALVGVADALDSASAMHAGHSLAGELLWGLDAVQHMHDQRGRLMVARLSLLQWTEEEGPPILNMASIVMARREATERAFREVFAGAIEAAGKTPAARRAAATPFVFPTPSWNQPMLDMMLPAIGMATRAFDVAALDVLGLRVIVAIELHRAQRGVLPASLDELVPTYLDALPADPWAADAALVYGLDGSRLGYRLYSVGHDAADDGGVRPPPGRWGPADRDALNGDAPGTDYVLTRETTGE